MPGKEMGGCGGVVCVAGRAAVVGWGREEVGTPGISECCGWPLCWMHRSRLSLYPLADAGKAGSTYSAYSNDIQKGDFAVW